MSPNTTEPYINLQNPSNRKEPCLDLSSSLTNEIFENKDLFNVPIKESKIVDFYRDKCVFITGATGFLGKILVEKLLRSCPDIQTIYILIRGKKGKDIHARMDEIYNNVVNT